jgi:hypothetical protein
MDSQAAHHSGQRELVEQGLARGSLVDEARGLDLPSTAEDALRRVVFGEDA